MIKRIKHIILPLLLFCGFLADAQDDETKIQGRVNTKKGDVTAIHVSNSTRNRGTITDENGFFTIGARFNDTLVFSAVQFKRKEVVITAEILENKSINVDLELSLTELDEVVVMPYNLSGVLSRDVSSLQIGPLKTAATENLPNANVISLTQTQRKLYAATLWDCECVGVKLDPLMNYFSGRTKMLNKREVYDSKVSLMKKVRAFYKDSLYIIDFKIPKPEIDNFLYFCEADSSFANMVAKDDKLRLWEFMRKKSLVFRKVNNID